MGRTRRLLALLLASLVPALECCSTTSVDKRPLPELRAAGAPQLWTPSVLTLEGPHLGENGDANPFLDYRLTVTFSSETTEYVVPGFFSCDGAASETSAVEGNKWRVYFVPDRPGPWTYTVSFERGPGLAISRSDAKGEKLPGDGTTGNLEVPGESSSQIKAGFLRYVGERYLRFAGSQEYFLKAGTDSPENFLAYKEFDSKTSPSRSGGVSRKGEAETSTGHLYEPHLRDWKEGDATWQGGKGKGILGALNYLASKGVNSVYFLTMNIKGDGNDVWPYTDMDERYRFDCSKLDQWNVVFDHMDKLGVMLHVVLTETENESLFEVEEGSDFADARKLYYRELIARFSHHQSLTWNIGEENGWSDRDWETGSPEKKGNTDQQRKDFADYIRALDPYDHPIVVHTLPGRYDEIYTPLLGFNSLEGPSLQISPPSGTYKETLKWINRSAEAGRKWFVCLDEIGPADTGVKPDSEDPDHDEVRRHALWGNLMAGGAGVEWYFGYRHAHNDLNLEDFRSRERMWDQTRHAVEFFKKYLPFWQMRSVPDWIQSEEGYCFAEPGFVYSVYLPIGKASTRLWLPSALYEVLWYNPRTGGELVEGSMNRIKGGGFRWIGQPPEEAQRDWVALVRLAEDPAPTDALEPPKRRQPGD